MKILQQGDRVIYVVNGKKMRGTVADVLPFKPQKEVPVKKRTKVAWIDRKRVRKLPERKNAA
jgi:hypothetical protein